MRRCRAALAVLTITLTSLVVAGPASAGGPTSVLLVVPGTGQTASLYTGDADYEALAASVGAFEASGVAGTVDPSGTSHEHGTGVTLTWLIHDVEVWRVDRVYVGADGGPWISTQSVAGGSGTIWDSPVVWHTAARGKELAALLDRLGVSPGSPAGDSGAVTPRNGAERDVDTDISASAAAAHESKQTASQEADIGTPSTGGLVWGLAGLTLGVALTMAGTRLLPNSRTATDEPATDEAAEDGPADTDISPGPASELNWLLTDELSSPPKRG